MRKRTLLTLFVFALCHCVSASIANGLKQKSDKFVNILMPKYQEKLREIHRNKRMYKNIDLDSNDLDEFKKPKTRKDYLALNTETFTQLKLSKNMSQFLVSLLRASVQKPSRRDINNVLDEYKRLSPNEKKLLGRAAPSEFKKIDDILKKQPLKI
ncbi:unnamed protein product [Bursaphelenchus okinawaensis]|uniref:Uncharacterized protein n=1 Tax=Bursaphelenchus okinawaensis TaxID=465554 RepID=A0A811KI69_9BILA|nr:unnamed protein product [Bursaphelenchus okinawaensis]CAG9102899.1 unnamed protein product [Bursaphelenchus okinawaensis]